MNINKQTSSVQLDVRDPDFYLDPYASYKILQEDCPVFYWGNYGYWTFVSYAHIDAILRDRRFGRSLDGCPLTQNFTEDKALQPFFDADRFSLLNLERPEHPRLRSLVQRSFVNSQIGSYRPFILDLAQELCDQISPAIEKGMPVDLKKTFAEPIPVLVIARMLGIPPSKKDDLLQWSHAMVRMYEPEKSRDVELAAAEASTQFMAYLHDLIAERKQNLGSDLISHLLRTAENDDSLTQAEIVSTIILLLNAGHEATVNIIGNAAVALMKNRDQLQHWCALADKESTALDTAVLELLRYDTPLHIFNRYVLADLEFGGYSFSRGQVVSLVLGAGNRDESVYKASARLDLTREPIANLSFGRGIHYCLGAPLAQMELLLALKVLFSRFPDLHILEEPVVTNTYHFRGYETIMVG